VQLLQLLALGPLAASCSVLLVDGWVVRETSNHAAVATLLCTRWIGYTQLAFVADRGVAMLNWRLLQIEDYA